MRKDIMRDYTEQDHRQRLQNIKRVESAVRSCRKKEMLMNYEPGHYIYHGREPGKPEEDAALFERMAKAGVKYIYTWSAWASPEHRWNGDPMFVPQDPEGAKCFLELAHSYGLKVLPYTSCNFFNRSSSYFNPDWAYSAAYDLQLGPDVEHSMSLAHCSPNSPGWRGHLLRQYVNLLDSFDYDGVYVDSGYIRRCDYISAAQYYEKEPVMVKDEIMAFREDASHDGGMEDLLSMISAEVRRRGKTISVFKEGTDRFRTDKDVFDYMLAGECATDIDFVRERVRDYKHVMLDFSPDHPIPEEEYYLNTLPFLHFPLLKRAAVTVPDPDTIIPDFDTGLGWLSLFRGLTEDGTLCYIDADCPSLVADKPEEVVCTWYVNRESYVVLANFAYEARTVTLQGEYEKLCPGKEETPVPSAIRLDGRELMVLKKR